MTSSIRQMKHGELPSVLALLERMGLPGEGVEDHQDSFLVATSEGKLQGAIGLEVYDSVGLLRSLAVEPGDQRKGLGAQLVESVLSMARDKNLDALYLLTTTAERYFPRFGFRQIRRDELDPRLGDSRELQGACPETAVCMRLDLSKRRQARHS